jgi:hypothetical protein
VRRLPRPVLILVILVAFLFFLAISAILARVFSVDGAERAALTALVQAEGRGDYEAMLHQMYRCTSPACRDRIAYDAAAYERPGRVQIAEINTSAGFALDSTIGTARIAWFASDPRPVVQCVRVRRAGNALTGFTIRLLQVSAKIKSSADCPKHY